MPQRLIITLSDEACEILASASDQADVMPAVLAADLLEGTLNHLRAHAEAESELAVALLNAEPMGHA